MTVLAEFSVAVVSAEVVRVAAPSASELTVPAVVAVTVAVTLVSVPLSESIKSVVGKPVKVMTASSSPLMSTLVNSLEEVNATPVATLVTANL